MNAFPDIPRPRYRWKGFIVAALLAFGLSFSGSVHVRGAPSDGASADPKQQARSSDHWAFQAIRESAPPSVRDISWPRTELDPFILADLEEHGIEPAEPAAREQWLRRATLDLTGLPPTVSELEEFASDTKPGAHGRVVERLLASPRYGERWGRHWLDLARFAESDGFEHDAVRPHAWRYRDYVIRSFNQDKPFDRFVKEQIAGDEVWPEDREARVATAFNLLGPDMVDSSDQVQRRHNSLNDMTDTTASVFLGLTVGCARCHDHKFEPISQRDYYKLQAFYVPAEFHRDFPIPNEHERNAHEKAMAEFNQREQRIRSELRKFEQPYRDQVYREKLDTLTDQERTAHATPADQRTAAQVALIKATTKAVSFPDKEWIARIPGEKRPDRDALLEQLSRLRKPDPPPMTLALADSAGPPTPGHVLIRGDYNQPADEVWPGLPGVLQPEDQDKATGTIRPSQHGATRAALADWIASPANPLTARVLVNRIWSHHFGKAIVPTPSDFGINGGKPSHPKLLDWLAARFIQSGWSLKQLHREIVLSATYRQSSRTTPDTLALDPENRFYSRFPRHRLEGEVIRDSLLAISGRLNPRMEGPGVYPPIPEDLFKGAPGWRVSEDRRTHGRRSVYIFARRNFRFPFLEVFDAPDNNLSCAARETSTSAPQSLTLLNSPEAVESAALVARHFEADATGADAKISKAFLQILGRSPDEPERELARAFLRHSPLSELCRALMNSNAFVYLE
ncbi:MAG: DUF1549 and DUF1553 domain-containing protein [Verrucomicrobia bacterium]|nr:DUF1549 and DUF1553 domain-containing protein [Verrucomicrobiota bacterium]